jgi:alkylation response protein AidB-like acyl-CoA dehydrogenase
MDFQLDADQLALQESMRAFCDGRMPADKLHETVDGFDAALWRELAELGVFNLRQSEDDGGVGLGMADAVIVFAELGRRLLPGPLSWTHLAADLIDGAASGETIVGGLDLPFRDSGPTLVEHLNDLDALLLLRPTGVYRVDAAVLAGEPIASPLDPLTPVHHVAQLPEGEQIGEPADATRLRLEGATLVAAQMVGIAEATLELAVAYAKSREQYGRPIGGFQAIKHLLADLFLRQEVARAAAYAAGATLDDPAVGDVARAVSGAKLLAGEAALRNSRGCIQVHGGMGYTWEVPAHFYLKRTWVLENVFGTSAEHCERVAERVDLAAD